MKDGKMKAGLRITSCLICLSVLLAACTNASTPVVLNTAAITITSGPTVTTTPKPPTLYLSDSLPEGTLDEEALVDLPISDLIEAPLWFGAAENSPSGDILQTATWVYALTAPFPTLTDNISLDELQAFWRGDTAEIFDTVTTLYIPEALFSILNHRWGELATSKITPLKSNPTPDALWEENAWAILPFEALDPKLKVITVDGISPLFKDFNVMDYPLTAQFQLVQTQTPGVTISNSFLETVLAAIQITNRDPEKMTTLVMTGVTALVRATAYRMEVHGVLYPGEKIVHWLSEADLTHISNEVSFYEDCPFPDPFSGMLLFCSDPKYIELLEYIGADIIELTGNHNNDALYVYGKDVVPFTLDLYQQRGMRYFGGGHDLEEAKSPLLVSHNGNQLAFIGCNAPGPDFAWATEDQGGAAPCDDFQWMADEITRLSNEGRLPIATFQYYEDYYNFAEVHHIRDFGLMAEAGAVIVNGSQAHRPKGMAFEHNAFIDYGLGNLFFDQMGVTIDGHLIEQTRWEIIQRHTFYDGRHLNVELLTAMLEDYAQPRPMTSRERLLFLDELFTASGWNSR